MARCHRRISQFASQTWAKAGKNLSAWAWVELLSELTPSSAMTHSF